MTIVPKRIALITGGMGGLGESISTKMYDAGFRVVVTHSPGNKNAVAWNADMKSRGYDFHPVPVDVADYDSCQACVTKLEAEVGAVEILVNNAGITRDSQLHRMKPEQWTAVINTNLGSLFNMTRQVIEGMRERKFGRIVNISSINGQKGQMGQTNYSAAKAGELGFTKALAQESARAGITVNAICPGYINTEMVQAVPKDVLEKNILPLIPIGRLGEPEEIARCVVFLASDEAGLITGSTLTANGGQYLT